MLPHAHKDTITAQFMQYVKADVLIVYAIYLDILHHLSAGLISLFYMKVGSFISEWILEYFESVHSNFLMSLMCWLFQAVPQVHIWRRR